ncbi:MAG: hypothetical protein EOM22_00840 [Gammaproteobacteria bacterium]|jgi:hypothetical protein|nr:hypothetical protein [Gammaproteobacteria bacterium]
MQRSQGLRRNPTREANRALRTQTVSGPFRVDTPLRRTECLCRHGITIKPRHQATRIRMGLTAELHQADKQQTGCERANDKSTHEMNPPKWPTGKQIGGLTGQRRCNEADRPG